MRKVMEFLKVVFIAVIWWVVAMTGVYSMAFWAHNGWNDAPPVQQINHNNYAEHPK